MPPRNRFDLSHFLSHARAHTYFLTHAHTHSLTQTGAPEIELTSKKRLFWNPEHMITHTSHTRTKLSFLAPSHTYMHTLTHSHTHRHTGNRADIKEESVLIPQHTFPHPLHTRIKLPFLTLTRTHSYLHQPTHIQHTHTHRLTDSYTLMPSPRTVSKRQWHFLLSHTHTCTRSLTLSNAQAYQK